MVNGCNQPLRSSRRAASGPIRLAVLAFVVVLPLAADTVILQDGSSYAGQFTGSSNGDITFVDG